MPLVLSATLVAGCGTGESVGQQDADLTAKGSIGRLFDNLTAFFDGKSKEDKPVATYEPYEFTGETDPGVDELFETLGLEEVAPDADATIDGALVSVYEYYADPDDPDDFDDDICFFAKPIEGKPSNEMLFWAELYGHRADNGQVSDIQGHPIGTEVVGGENIDGDQTRVIFYVNGIKTDGEAHCSTLQTIADVSGGVVVGVMNDTEGTLKDMWQTGWDRFSVLVERKLEQWGVEHIAAIHNNEAATTLMNVTIQRIREGKRVEIWAHSQGGAVASLALTRALRQLKSESLFPVVEDGVEITDAIKVMTFGSASPRWTGKWPEGPSYTHFVHLRDATPSVLGIGAFGKFTSVGKPRAGEGATVHFFDGEPPEEYEPSNFQTIPPEEADVSFLKLKTQRYHSVEGTYLKAFAQTYGNWSEVEFEGGEK